MAVPRARAERSAQITRRVGACERGLCELRVLAVAIRVKQFAFAWVETYLAHDERRPRDDGVDQRVERGRICL